MSRNVILLCLLSVLMISCQKEIVIEPSEDDTLAFKDAILSAKAHDTIYILPGIYNINDSMPEIRVPLLLRSTRAIINLTNVSQFLTVKARNVDISGFYIQGDNVSNGILAHDNSWLNMEKITFIDLNVALEFDNFHDSDFDSLKFYSNHTDLLANKRPISSLRFKHSHFELSEYALKINTDITNLAFRDCGFAPTGTDNPIQIIGASFSSLFQGNRIELKSLANGLYFQGKTHTYPIQTIVIDSNYFSGKIKSGIVMDTYTNNNTISNNHFQTNPEFADIVNYSPKNLVISNNHPSTHLGRDLVVQ